MKIIILLVLILEHSCNDSNDNKGEIFSESSCLSDETSKEKSCETKDKTEDLKLFRWDPVEIGYERELQLEIGKTHKMVTKAVHPPVFVIDNYMEDYECDHIISKANEAGLFSSALHLDDKTIESKSYMRYNLTDYTAIFHNIDLNRDGKINIPTEIKSIAYTINHLYLKNDEVEEIIKKFEMIVTEENGERWISRENYEKVNHGGFLEYLSDLREMHPHHRDRYSDQVWLNAHHESDKIVHNLMTRLEKVTGLQKEIVYGTEPIQVVRYLPHGHYHAHFDSQNKSAFPDYPCCHTFAGGTPQNCRICRYMTVLVFLNDVIKGGETAFPVADDNLYTHEDFMKRSKGDMYNLSEFCYDGKLVVKPKKGRLVMWYNHLVNEEGLLGILDPYSLHGGCDVIEGEKWIANNWIPAPDTQNAFHKNVYAPHMAENKSTYTFKAEETVAKEEL